MQRAKVCVRFVKMSGKNHLRLVKVKDKLPEIADHEAAYLDNTGKNRMFLSVWMLKASCEAETLTVLILADQAAAERLVCSL